MKRWVLVGLNLCMHLGEVRDLLWKDFDLDKGTYYAIRNKTKRRRIPRAATLWPETIEVLKKLYNPKHTYVFTSRYGSKYSRTYSTTFFRGKADKLGLHDLTFESIRDGSYTAAIRAPGVDEKFARLLAGHASQGLQDSYVARNPEMVKSACDAVRKYYLG
jgi:integrase